MLGKISMFNKFATKQGSIFINETKASIFHRANLQAFILQGWTFIISSLIVNPLRRREGEKCEYLGALFVLNFNANRTLFF
jgi:hypothetical protein